MPEVLIARAIPAAAFEALHITLQAVFGAKFAGILSRKDAISLLFHETATPQDEQIARDIALCFDIHTRTDAQRQQERRRTDFANLMAEADELIALCSSTAAACRADHEVLAAGNNPVTLDTVLARQYMTFVTLEKLIRGMMIWSS